MELYGILGEKLGHSLSPRIHKIIFQAVDVEGEYKLFEVTNDSLDKFIQDLKTLDLKGLNVTIPYKVEIMKYLDIISPEAERIGAVNTIALEDNKLYGYNTDYYGFGYMLEVHNVKVKNSVAVILGNGGATKAISYYLLDNGIEKLYIVSRNPENNKGLKNDKIEIISYEQLKNIKGDIIINATPVGMFPKEDATPVGDEVIVNFDTLVDIVYNPAKTEFMLRGEALGKRIVGGLYMLIGQGVKSQEIWQKTAIDDKVIKDIYEIFSREFS